MEISGAAAKNILALGPLPEGMYISPPGIPAAGKPKFPPELKPLDPLVLMGALKPPFCMPMPPPKTPPGKPVPPEKPPAPLKPPPPNPEPPKILGFKLREPIG